MKTKPNFPTLVAVMAFALLATAFVSDFRLAAADHRDAPAIDEDPRADINASSPS